MRSCSTAVACAVLLGVLTSAPGPAAAQADAAPPGDAARDLYKQHMANGVKLYQDKNFSAAIAEFDAAYAAKPNANPLMNIALCRKGMFDYPAAIAAGERALSLHGDAMPAEDKTAAQAAMNEMRGLLAYVTVTIEPAEATLVVDGRERPPGSWSSPLALGPGAHRIGARADGYAPAEQTLIVASGDKDKVITLRLTSNQGRVTIAAKDKGAAIAVDGKQVGSGQWSGLLPPGTHQVQFFRGGNLTATTQILVAAGKEQSVQEPNPAPADARDAPEVGMEPPRMRGFYGLVTASVFFPTGSPGSEDVDIQQQRSINEALARAPGGAAGLRLGYRFNNVVGLELMLEYRNLEGSAGAPGSGDASDSEQSDQSYRSARFGGNLG